MSVDLQTTDSEMNLQKPARRILTLLYATLQVLKLYPVENDAVQRTVQELHTQARRLLEKDGHIEVRLIEGCFFLNQTRLRLDLTNHAVFDGLSQTLALHEIGTIAIESDVAYHEWTTFLALFLEGAPCPEPFEAFDEALHETTVQSIQVRKATKSLQDPERVEVAKRVYQQTVQAARGFLTGVRLGRATNVRRVKRSVQAMVDQVMSNQTALLGMTTLQEFDKYTFTHSVNVCILCIVLGHKLGLDKQWLYELGLCGLFHDIGKMRIDWDIVNKPGRLDEKEWEQMKQHPKEGLLALFKIHGFTDIPFRQMLAAYEHHMKVDFSGYPTIRRVRKPSLFTRIVSVVDTFDAVTSIRSYRSRAWPPDQVLKNMRDEPAWGLDHVLVKAFINATGIYPVGTVVILDDRRFAVVTAPNPEYPHAPTVKVIADSNGKALPEPQTLDLCDGDSAPTPGASRILRSIDPSRHKINVSQYFL